MSSIDKLLSQDSVRNVSFTLCCAQIFCQDFPREKMILLREKVLGFVL